MRRTCPALFLVAALAAGCKHPTPACAPSLPSDFELRDRGGAIELALRAAPPREDRPPDPRARDLCDGNDRLQARLVDRGGGALTLENAAGDPQAKIVPATEKGGDATLELLDPARPLGPFRIHAGDDLLRLLDPIGVPLAQIATHDGKASALDAAGVTLATCELVDGKRVVRGRDGAVAHYVTGIADSRAAAIFAIDALPAPVRLLLARHLDRN